MSKNLIDISRRQNRPISQTKQNLAENFYQNGRAR